MLKYLGADLRVSPWSVDAQKFYGPRPTPVGPTIDRAVWPAAPDSNEVAPWSPPSEAWSKHPGAELVPVLFGVLARTGASEDGCPAELPDAATEPFILPEGFALAGFDVADGSLYSAVWGLSAGRLEQDRRSLIRDAGAYGLLGSQSAADTFKSWCDRNQREAFHHHGPFWVIAVAVPTRWLGAFVPSS